MNAKRGETGKPHHTIIGAGVVGSACALALAREGFPVTIIERGEPGMGASYGNAGFIQTGTPLPFATPGILGQLPKLLFDPESPLKLRWRYLPRLTPFLLRLLANARVSKVEANARALQAMLGRSGEAHRAMLHQAGGTDLIRARGLLMVYPNQASFDHAEWEVDLFRRNGVPVEALRDDAVWQMEPALNHDYRWAYHLPETFYTVDPLAITQRYLKHAQLHGAELVRDEVRDIEMNSGGPSALICASGRRDVDQLVLAAGIQSLPLAKRLGHSVPMESARGYHLMLPEPGVELQAPVVDGEMHFGVTPMRAGVRLAGTVEFASVDAPPNEARARMLYPMARKMIPDLRDAGAESWMGHRPTLPDSLPILGPSPKHANVLLAFGHASLGLTMAAATGEIIAKLAAGADPGLDLTPYRPDRF
ncbi:MAG TPA: FAD-dependent oxidoreductase [Alphaproteobacteria bacterium]|nr:FAD-dependent oxidoreductase [Alphaproteobacteria bacterium]